MDRSWKCLIDQAFADEKFLCAGLDPKFDPYWENADTAFKNAIMEELTDFCLAKVRAVAPVAGFIKPNWAFFVQYGWRGLRVLEKIVRCIHLESPNVVVILDMKLGDIGDTNVAYARAAFDELGGDAITLHPYLGKMANQPFLDYTKKGIIVLCHTSNVGADEFQHLSVEHESLYLKVASNVSKNWNEYGNCGLVTGATYPEAIIKARSLAPSVPLLIPGIGKQGGSLEASVKGSMGSDGAGFIVSASSSIIYAQDSGKEAQDLHEAILAARH